jgi:hypothetical protein
MMWIFGLISEDMHRRKVLQVNKVACKKQRCIKMLYKEHVRKEVELEILKLQQ